MAPKKPAAKEKTVAKPKAEVHAPLAYSDLDREALEAELVKRGFAEEDIIDLEDIELVAQLEQDDIDTGKVKPVEKGAEPVKVKNEGEFVDVVKGTEYVRTYSAALHGEDFADIAKGFCSKESGRTILAPGKIKSLLVKYRIENAKTKAWSFLTKRFSTREEAVTFFTSLPGNIKKVITWSE